MAELEITTAEDANRLRCPNGHASVGPANNHWHCVSCARYWGDDVEPEFDKVRDAQTGREYTRDQVEIDPSVPGCYYV